MASITKSMVVSAADKKMIDVEIPEWGGTAKLRVMSGSERDRFEGEFQGDKKSVDDVRAKMVSKCLCDDEGVRLFSEAEVPLLGEKSAAVLDRLFTMCMKLNRFSKDDVEELASNS